MLGKGKDQEENLEKASLSSILNSKGFRNVLSIIVILIVVNIAFVGIKKIFNKPNIVSIQGLEKIINVSDLSTFQSIYNGIVTVYDEEDDKEVDYHVTYNSRIKAGINIEEIEIDIDQDEKVVTIILPETKIIDVNVDIASLDFLFIDNEANTATVSEEAYNEAILDVEEATKNNEIIYELAEQNAKNTMIALIEPFVNEFDEEYTINVIVKGEQQNET